MTRIVPLALAVGLAGAALAGMPPVPVEVAQATRGSVQSVLPTVGTVHALREVKVGSKIAERVEKLLVEEGDPVKAGQVICQLDVTTTTLQLAEAAARLAEDKAVLEKLEAGLRPNQIKQVEAELEEQKATMEKLRLDAERMKTLFAKGVVSDAERDKAVADYDTARARLKRVEAALALAREGTRQEEIAEARATVRLREAEIASIEQRLTDATIASPVTGYVVRKLVEVGEWTQIGGTVAEVIDTSVLRVHTTVTEKLIRQIREGQKAVIHLDAYPGQRFDGTVYRIIPKADLASRSFPVQVNVDKPDTVVKAGMFARVSFVLAERPDVLLVPEDALVLRGGLTLVYKALPIPKEMLQAMMGGGQGGPPGAGKQGGPPGGGQGGPPKEGQGGPPGGAPGGMPPLPGPMFLASRVVVKTGARQEGRIEIREIVDGKLEAGDVIVVTGNENLRDNAPMVVVRGLPAGGQGAPPAAGGGEAKGPPAP